MSRKKKPSRISLKQPKVQGGKKYQQALMYPEDHANLPALAGRIKAAHPDREIAVIADVLHFMKECTETHLTLAGA